MTQPPNSILPIGGSSRSSVAALPTARQRLLEAAKYDLNFANMGLLEGFKKRLLLFRQELQQPDQLSPWLAIAAFTATLIYSYWPGLLNAQSSWSNPQYSHGWIIPLFSIALLF